MKENQEFDTKEIFVFLEKEFISLREEIKASKEREFKVVVSGIMGTPVLAYISQQHAVKAISYLLPIIVIVMVLLYLSERHTVMRAGTYIKSKIEPLHAGVCGWESWLSCKQKIFVPGGTRTPDIYSATALSLLFFFYYIGAACYAVNNFKPALYEYGNMLQSLIVSIYVSLGVLLCYVLARSLISDTFLAHCDEQCAKRKKFMRLLKYLKIEPDDAAVISSLFHRNRK